VPANGVAGTHLALAHLFLQVIGEPAGKLEHRFCGRVIADQRGSHFQRISTPAKR
jgi:hypothetical protein